MYAIRVPQTALYVHLLWYALSAMQALVSSTQPATPPVQTVIGFRIVQSAPHATQNAKYALPLQLTVHLALLQGQTQLFF